MTLTLLWQVAQERRARVVAQQTPGAAQPHCRSRSPQGLTQNILLSESAEVGGGRAFPSCTNLFLANSHQNSHSPKIKMAADLAASHLIDFKVFLAPQVGLEPTTLRLTAECSAIELLRNSWR